MEHFTEMTMEMRNSAINFYTKTLNISDLKRDKEGETHKNLRIKKN